jgi:high-affinity iron transporter
VIVSNALIGLREGLEAALVVVILIAFLVKTGRAHAVRHVWLGVAAAVGLSVVAGAYLTYGTQRLSFETQELIGGFASIVAVAFVTGMVMWMRTAARTLSGELTGRLDRALDVGPLAVAAVGFLGVGREGLESAIFFHATAQAAGAGNAQPLLGWAIGLSAAIAMGLGIYRGALRINLAQFFRWTGALLVLVAAGILAYGIHDLQEAGTLPGLRTLAFDLRAVIDPSSLPAALLKGIFNITPATTVLQALAWLAYVGVVLPLLLRRPTPPARAAAPQAATAASRS